MERVEISDKNITHLYQKQIITQKQDKTWLIHSFLSEVSGEKSVSLKSQFPDCTYFYRKFFA